jgi:glycosyltransferase involved in cell wall biosynthesis
MALRLGHHGTIVERFGVDLAVQAVANLRAREVEVSLRILGDGDFAGTVEALIDRLGARSFVSFDRRQFAAADLEAFTAQIDVGIAPYRSSPFVENGIPTKVLEYMALGVPTIVTETGMVRDRLATDAVRMVRAGSVPDLEAAILELRDPSRRAGLVKAGSMAFRELGWPPQRQQLLDLIGGLTSPAPS